MVAIWTEKSNIYEDVIFHLLLKTSELRMTDWKIIVILAMHALVIHKLFLKVISSVISKIAVRILEHCSLGKFEHIILCSILYSNRHEKYHSSTNP